MEGQGACEASSGSRAAGCAGSSPAFGLPAPAGASRQPAGTAYFTPPPAGRPNHALPASPSMRLRDFELAVVEDGSRQPLPEVTAESGDTYVIAAPGQQFEVQVSFQDAWRMRPNTVYLVRWWVGGRCLPGMQRRSEPFGNTVHPTPLSAGGAERRRPLCGVHKDLGAAIRRPAHDLAGLPEVLRCHGREKAPHYVLHLGAACAPARPPMPPRDHSLSPCPLQTLMAHPTSPSNLLAPLRTRASA